MKIFVLFMFLTLESFAQDAFIETNSGDKILIKGNSVQVYVNDKVVIYKELDNNSENTLDFSDINTINYSVYKFKTFKFNNADTPEGFYIIASSKTNSLISILYPDPETTYKKYIFHVVNNQNNSIYSFTFDNLNEPKSIISRNEIFSKIKNYFPNCSDLLSRLNEYNNKDEDFSNLSILSFFNTPIFNNCD